MAAALERTPPSIIVERRAKRSSLCVNAYEIHNSHPQPSDPTERRCANPGFARLVRRDHATRQPERARERGERAGARRPPTPAKLRTLITATWSTAHGMEKLNCTTHTHTRTRRSAIVWCSSACSCRARWNQLPSVEHAYTSSPRQPLPARLPGRSNPASTRDGRWE